MTWMGSRACPPVPVAAGPRDHLGRARGDRPVGRSECDTSAQGRVWPALMQVARRTIRGWSGIAGVGVRSTIEVSAMITDSGQSRRPVTLRNVAWRRVPRCPGRAASVADNYWSWPFRGGLVARRNLWSARCVATPAIHAGSPNPVRFGYFPPGWPARAARSAVRWITIALRGILVT